MSKPQGINSSMDSKHYVPNERTGKMEKSTERRNGTNKFTKLTIMFNKIIDDEKTVKPKLKNSMATKILMSNRLFITICDDQ